MQKSAKGIAPVFEVLCMIAEGSLLISHHQSHLPRDEKVRPKLTVYRIMRAFQQVDADD
jgi:hypothetical protein